MNQMECLRAENRRLREEVARLREVRRQALVLCSFLPPPAAHFIPANNLRVALGILEPGPWAKAKPVALVREGEAP